MADPKPAGAPCDAATPSEARLLGEILAVVRERRGVDFAEYRPATIGRRVRNRMLAAGAPTLAVYLDRLRRERGEADLLVERLTIKVSRFFRDGAAVEAVRKALAGRAGPGARLTAWSAGCARGEEAYTLAILLAELQPEGPPPHVLGTDIDPFALAAARAAAYPAEALAEVPSPLRARWFDGPGEGGLYRVSEDLRGRVELRPGDLAAATGPPGERRFDLVACRNTLVYFTPALQARVLVRLCGALRTEGLLWLGEAEWPVGEAAEWLRVVDRKARLFALEPWSEKLG